MAPTTQPGSRALLETLQNVSTGTTTTTTASPSTISNNHQVEPEAPHHDFLRHVIDDVTNGTELELSNFHLGSFWPQNTNTTMHLNGTTTTTSPSVLSDENTTDPAAWLSIRLIIIVSILVCLVLLACGSYKLHNRCAARRRRRTYKSTLLLYGGEVTVR